MATEAKRGCGYRKVGGIYMCADGSGGPCCKMPIPLRVCPTCNQGIKQTRGFQWIDPTPWLKGGCTWRRPFCPLAQPGVLPDKVGLLWIGAEHYDRPEAFNDEAARLGISRRIRAIPRGFEVGKSWVFLAHPRVLFEDDKWVGGLFRIIRPDRFETIVTETMARDGELMDDLSDRGLVPVIVPDGDTDHAAPAERKTKPRRPRQLELPT